MTDVTVKFLAMEIKIPVERLIQQFADAGLNKTAVDFVTSQEKEILLVHLNKGRKIILNELTLQRKTRSTLNVPSIGGKSKQVQVEVRKKRIYVASEPQIYHHQVMSDDKVINNIVENKKINAVVHNDEIIHQNDISCSSNSTNFIDKCDQDVAVAKIKHEVQKVDYHKAKVKTKIQGVVNVLGDVVKNKRNDRHHRFDSLFDVRKNNNRDYQSPILHVRCKGENKNNLKGENDRRSRTRVRSKSRGLKVIKFRKHYNYDVVSDAKNEHEESRSFNRSIKIKQLKLHNNNLMQAFNKPTKFVARDVVIGETITVVDLANRMAVKSSYLIKTMMNLGIMATLNQILDRDTAQLVVEEMGHKVILYRDNALEELVLNDRNVNVINNATKVRAPVVTIMGHVDHGKTSLLDYIRSSRVAITEVGGITQHIGAYHVETSNGMITFLDTPGHAAFTAMRARGTKVTDIVVLVIAADDGVMLQTIEAIKHAKAAQVPIIVAINKIDKSEANPDRIKNELVKYGVIPEEWGGDNQFIHVSAKLGTGVNDLLEAIILQAEILELKTVYDGMASGVVIEAYLDKSRGPVATVLVREGTLKRGDVVLCGFEYGRIRYMRDEMGRNITFAGPSIPVEIFGLSGSPIAGDILTVVRDEKKAREVAFYRQGKFRDIKLSCQKESKLKHVFSNMIHASHDVISELNIVLKSDFQGSSEAIVESLQSLSTDKVKIKIVYSSIGSITETDVSLAMASNAILLGFNVRADASARRIINIEKIDIRYYCVIYDLINEVKQYLDDLFVPRYKQEIIGVAEVRSVFRSPKYGFIAGCMVIEGIMKRHNQMRILRDNVSIYEGELDSLRRFKDDVNEVRHGMECGIGIKNYVDICSGDRIEVLNKVVSD